MEGWKRTPVIGLIAIVCCFAIKHRIGMTANNNCNDSPLSRSFVVFVSWLAWSIVADGKVRFKLTSSSSVDDRSCASHLGLGCDACGAVLRHQPSTTQTDNIASDGWGNARLIHSSRMK